VLRYYIIYALLNAIYVCNLKISDWYLLDDVVLILISNTSSNKWKLLKYPLSVVLLVSSAPITGWGGDGGHFFPTTYRRPRHYNRSTYNIPPPIKIVWALKKYPISMPIPPLCFLLIRALLVSCNIMPMKLSFLLPVIVTNVNMPVVLLIFKLSVLH